MRISLVLFVAFLATAEAAPPELSIARPRTNWTARPLEQLTVVAAPGATLVVRDGEGRIYQRLPVAAHVTITVGGALGTQSIEARDAQGRVVAASSFPVDAATSVDDHGRFQDLFRLCEKTMLGEQSNGVGSIVWRGKTYRYFVPWILDHSNTAKGMQYLSPVAGEMVDLLSQAQKEDGMIWSFVAPDPGPEHAYHYWAYHDQGYARADGGVLFVRQPVENHNEANFVDALYLSWKGSGDDAWMAGHLDNARRALDYTVSSPVRWSSSFGLLKRGYTIDSWDFQPEDALLAPFRMGAAQQIDPLRTKFAIFFGDNTAYARACDQLAEMLRHAGREAEADRYRQRARQIRERLDKVAWNGRYYVHHLEEDPSVVRNLGVDERTQLAMSNMYSLNRGVSAAQADSIIRTYQDLKARLPARSPGEWYSVYPPYDNGFGTDSPRWQYMNAGVQVHAAGELARGAFEFGYESYGADILSRVRDLGRRYGDKLYFAYTGAWDPAPPPAQFTPIDIAAQANMDLGAGGSGVPGWMGQTDGNDMRGLPVGHRVFAGVPWLVPDPARNGHRAVISANGNRVEVPVGKKAAAIYLLHTAVQVGPSKVAGILRFEYAGGASHTVYLMEGKHLAGFWFPSLEAEDAGVAWRGANGVCGDVGVTWAAIANPQPDKEIEKLVFAGSEEGSTYAVMGVTLASAMPYHEANPVSFGGAG
jgi:hypothetical protein